MLSSAPCFSIVASSWRCFKSPVSSCSVSTRDACDGRRMGVGNNIISSHKTGFCFAQSFRNVHTLRFGLKSGPMRRASTGISPLLRLWLPSPEVAVKSLAVRGKSVHQSHRVATLFFVTFVNRESDTPVPPYWYASRTPHPTNAPPESTLEKGGKPLGFVAYSVFLRSIVTHRIHHLSPKFAWSRPTRSLHAAEGIVEDAAPYRENPSQVPQVPQSILLLRPNVPPCCSRNLASRCCASHSTFFPRASLQRSSLSEMRRPCSGCRQRTQRNVISSSFRSTRVGKHGSSR